VADRSMSVPVTLSDPEGRGMGVKIFWQTSIITLVQFDTE